MNELSFETLSKYLDVKEITSLALEYIPRILGAALILWLGFKLVKKLDKILEKSLAKLQVSDTMRPFIISMINTFSKIVIVLVAVSIVGVKLSGLVAVFAAMGFAIGMSLQGSLGNFASGILILFLKPYEVNDWIQVGDSFGRVEEIGIFNTLLITPGNKTLIVPNAKITDDVVTNYSKKGIVRLELNAHIPYSEDFPKVKSLIENELKSLKYILNDPTPEIGIETFDSHNIVLAIRPYAKPDFYWEATFEGHQAIKDVFNKNNVKVAYSEGVELGSIGA